MLKGGICAFVFVEDTDVLLVVAVGLGDLSCGAAGIMVCVDGQCSEWNELDASCIYPLLLGCSDSEDRCSSMSLPLSEWMAAVFSLSWMAAALMDTYDVSVCSS